MNINFFSKIQGEGFSILTFYNRALTKVYDSVYLEKESHATITSIQEI